MSETTDGAIGGAMQGAKMGSMIAPGIGTVIGGVVGAVGGFFKGKKAKKKRQEAERRRAEAMKKMVESIQGRKRRANRYLSDQEKYKDQMLEKVLDNYTQVKMAWDLYDDEQKAIITQKHGDIMGQLDQSLKTQLNLNDDLFKVVENDLEEMRSYYIPALQEDINENEATRAEFKQVADQSIAKVSEIQGQREKTLNQLQESGGLPEYYNQEISDLEKGFDDAEHKIEKYNPNESGRLQQKMSNAFAKAMATGNVSAQMREQGKAEERALQDAISNASIQQMNMAGIRQDRNQTDANTRLADAQMRFDQAKLDEFKGAKLREMGIQDRDQMQRLQAIMSKYNSLADLNSAVAKGQISNQDLKFLREQGIEDNFNAVKGKVLDIHNSIDKEFEALYGQTAGVANAQANKQTQAMDTYKKQGISSMMDMLSGGGGKSIMDGFGNIFTKPMGKPTADTGMKLGYDYNPGQNQLNFNPEISVNPNTGQSHNLGSLNVDVVQGKKASPSIYDDKKHLNFNTNLGF